MSHHSTSVEGAVSWARSSGFKFETPLRRSLPIAPLSDRIALARTQIATSRFEATGEAKSVARFNDYRELVSAGSMSFALQPAPLHDEAGGPKTTCAIVRFGS